MSNEKSNRKSNFTFLCQLEEELESSRSLREKAKNKQKVSQPAGESHKRCSPSPLDKNDLKRSRKEKKTSTPVFIADNIDYDIPDRSFGDFFCKLCDAHMNAETAWETHIQGKRHLKNLKKDDLDLKYDTLDEDPQMLSELEIVDDPIVGLNHCCEYQRLEGRPIYQCFLCSANVPNGKALIEHLKGTKHMMAYLKEHDPHAHQAITSTQLTHKMVDPIIKEYALNHRKRHGLGKMQVKRERVKAPAVSYYKSTYKDDFTYNKERDDRCRYSQRYDRKEYRHGYYKRDSKDSKGAYPERVPRGDHSERDIWRKISDKYETKYRGLSPQKNYENSPTKKSSWYDRETSSCNSQESSPRDDYSFYGAERLSAFDRHDSSNSSKLSPSYNKKEQYLQTRRSLTPPLSSPPPSIDIRREDLRVVLEQRKKEANVSEESHSAYIKKILDVLCSLPNMIFLELVRVRVEQIKQITLSEEELSLLKTVGSLMVSICFSKRINGLSSEMLNIVANGKTTEPEIMKSNSDTSGKSSNLSDLMKLITDLKSTPLPTFSSSDKSCTIKPNQPTSSDKPFNTSIKQLYSIVQRTENESVFTTPVASTSQSLWSDKNNLSFTYETKGIPGLTLSESSSTYEMFPSNESAVTYPSSHYQKPQDPIGTNSKTSSWPPSTEYKSYYNHNRY